MKKQDLYFVIILSLFILPFIIFNDLFDHYLAFNKAHGMITSFIKFGLLATLGEVIGLRIRTKSYNIKGFGVFPKFIVWGFLGLTIKMAFIIFATGTPLFLEYMGIKDASTLLKGSFSLTQVLIAFSISTAMNVIYAPVMMTFHKITDLHIADNAGKTKSLFTPIAFAKQFNRIDWNIQWNFVFKKTIPFFWIPAHTFTFLLPPDFQVLFAALLSVVLGMILAVASLKSEK